ncbi:hypothetical protein [Azohydromonas sp.]|uniref:hypothetical protein n=1 Tax=Azohydromonas sp. TaxID=1872666 RepID=UPI002C1CA876|nr:hypothetical protein [Azohydromonas sp.]HMM85784.1 hypothetical protein [Azohydromonas sp.]
MFSLWLWAVAPDGQAGSLFGALLQPLLGIAVAVGVVLSLVAVYKMSISLDPRRSLAWLIVVAQFVPIIGLLIVISMILKLRRESQLVPASADGVGAAGAASDASADDDEQRGRCLTPLLREAESMLSREQSERARPPSGSAGLAGSASDSRPSMHVAPADMTRSNRGRTACRLLRIEGQPVSIPLLITVLGPTLGVFGLAGGLAWLLWTGVAVCAPSPAPCPSRAKIGLAQAWNREWLAGRQASHLGCDGGSRGFLKRPSLGWTG